MAGADRASIAAGAVGRRSDRAAEQRGLRRARRRAREAGAGQHAPRRRQRRHGAPIGRQGRRGRVLVSIPFACAARAGELAGAFQQRQARDVVAQPDAGGRTRRRGALARYPGERHHLAHPEIGRRLRPAADERLRA